MQPPSESPSESVSVSVSVSPSVSVSTSVSESPSISPSLSESASEPMWASPAPESLPGEPSFWPRPLLHDEQERRKRNTNRKTFMQRLPTSTDLGLTMGAL